MRAIYFLLLVLLLPLSTFAHTTGTSVERQVGDYMVDIGYDPQQPSAGETLRLDFNLWSKGKAREVPFTSAWVRLEDSQGLIFAGPVAKATFGLTGVTIFTPRAGAYTLSVRFQDGDKTIVESSVPIPVEAAAAASGDTSGDSSYIVAIATAVVALAVGFVAGRKLRR